MTENDAQCAMPSVDERIGGLRRDVNALFRLLPDNFEREERLRHKQRWHATYNAALPEAMRYWAERDEEDDDVAHQWATQMANRAHGQLDRSTKANNDENAP